MAGILGINAAFGNTALSDEQSSQVDMANHTMYNDAIRRDNKENLGQLLMTGGKAAVAAGIKAKQLHDQNQRQKAMEGDMESSDDPRDQKALAASNANGTQSPADSSGMMGLSGGQWSQLAGMFMNGLNGMGGSGGGGSAPSGSGGP